MMRKLFYIITFVVLSVWSNRLSAQAFIVTSGTDNVTASNSYTTESNEYSNSYLPGQDFDEISVKNRVILRVNHGSGDLMNAFTATVEVDIKSYEFNGTSYDLTPTQTYSKTLTVSYDVFNEYNDKSIFEFEDGYMVEVVISSVTIQPLNASASLHLDTEIESELCYNIDRNDQVSGVSFDDSKLTSDGLLKINWTTALNAKEYDLEWVHINAYDATAGNYLSPSGISLDERLFDLNSTRVTTQNNYYEFPYLYDKGYILCRVRPVGCTVDNSETYVIEGGWSGSITSGMTLNNYTTNHYYPTSTAGLYAHNEDLNWQSTTSFAEEGKSKAVVSYFDGTQKNRQTVTKINSDEQAIVGESIYDYQGRPAIQVLPAPTGDGEIKFYPDFNLDGSSGNPYDYTHFDLDGGSCDGTANPMAISSGSAKYYSPSSTSASRYVPDAGDATSGRFPFSQTVYTPDNTGRIKAQGGVGLHHQIGSGHETKYYYVTPFQEEIDALFGSEAAYSDHFKKNAVVDPNGQASVSIMDLSGKVIATSLAGDAPDKMASINSSSYPLVSIDLLNKEDANDYLGSNNKADAEAGTRIYDEDIFVSNESEMEFSYQMDGARFEYDQDDNGSLSDACDFCADCVYNLMISLKDDCDEEYLYGVGGSTSNSIIIDADMTSSDVDISNCTSSITFDSESEISSSWKSNDGSTNVELPVGKYTLLKKLEINKEAMYDYLEQFLTNQCLSSEEDFITTQQGLVVKTNCEYDCEKCTTLVNSLEEVADDAPSRTAPNTITTSNKAKHLAACAELCDETLGTCEAYLTNLLTDVQPGGQYGLYANSGSIVYGIYTEPDEDGIDPSKYPLSVFNENNLLPRKYDASYQMELFPDWRHPYVPEEIVSSLSNRHVYLDEFGDIATVEISYDPITETYDPEVKSGKVWVDRSGETDRYYAFPQDLLYVEDFIDNWQTSWANSLVYYHPEYCYYVYCTEIEPSHEFDADWMEDFSDFDDINATWRGNSASAILDLDPFFYDGDGNIGCLYDEDARTAMINAMTNYSNDGTTTYDIWETTWIIVNCDKQPSCYASSLSCSPTSGYALQTLEEWNVFRTLYLGLKQKIQEKHRNKFLLGDLSTCSSCYAYNLCIGDDGFDVFKNGFYEASFSPLYSSLWQSSPYDFEGSVSSQFYNPEQACNYARYHLYKNKTARFPSADQVAGMGFESLPCYESGYTVNYCPTELTSLMEEKKEIAEKSYYDQCGQCPNAMYLQQILNAIVENTSDALDKASSFSLSCTYPEFNDDLATAIDPAGTAVSWAWQSTTSGLLTAQLSYTSGYKTINIQIPSALTSIYSFSDITHLCCIQYTGANGSYDQFTLMASVVVESGDPDYDYYPDFTQVRQFELECEIDIDINTCDFGTFCTTDQTPKQMQNLFDVLILNGEFLTDNVDLTSSSADVEYPNIITEAMLSYLPDYDESTENLEWNGNGVSGNTLTATIENNTTSADACTITFTKDASAPFTFAQIEKIENIRPDASGSLNDFEAEVIYDNGSTDYYTISGSISCMEIGECSSELDASLQNGNVNDEVANSGYLKCTSASAVTTLESELDAYTFTSGYSITTSLTTSGTVYLDMEPHGGYDFSDVTGVRDIEPDQEKLDMDGTTNYFVAIAELPSGKEVKIYGYAPSVNIGQCAIRFNGACNLDLFADMLQNELNSQINTGVLSSNSTSLGSNAYSISNLSDLGACSTLVITIPSTTSKGISDIVEFSDIRADNIITDLSGNTEYFVILAEMDDGSLVEIQGKSNCTIGSCETCEQYASVENYDFSTALASNACGTGVCQCTNTFQSTVGFDSDHLYQYLWSGCTSDLNTYRIDDGTNIGLPVTLGSTGNALIVRGTVSLVSSPVKTWVQEIKVDPYQDYQFMVDVSRITTNGSAPKLDLGYVDGSGNFVSFLQNGRAYLTDDNDDPVLISPTTSGVEINLDASSDPIWREMAAVFNPGSDTKIELAIVAYENTGGYDFALDNVRVKSMGCSNTSNDAMCNDYSPNALSVLSPQEQCEQLLDNYGEANGKFKYQEYEKQVVEWFINSYMTQCMNVNEDFNAEYYKGEYQTTLYYYDQAGNLVRTVPPKGVSEIDLDTYGSQIKGDRKNHEKTMITEHDMATTYTYNSLNQLVAQTMPDQQQMDIWEEEDRDNGIPSGANMIATEFFDENNGIALVNLDIDGNSTTEGVIYTTADGGKTWTMATDFGINDLNAAQFADDDIVYAVGDQGSCIKSTDAGANWEVRNLPTTENLIGLHFISALKGFVFEEDGTMWETADGGVSWNKSLYQGLEDPDLMLTRVSFYDDDNGVVVGKRKELDENYYGVLRTTQYRGSSWNIINPRFGQLNVVDGSSYYTYIGGDNATLLTNDIGKYRMIPNNLSPTQDIVDLSFTTDMKGTALLDNNELYYSSDNGENWALKYTSCSAMHYAIYDMITATSPAYLIDRTIGYASISGNLYKTGDGGSSWTDMGSTGITPYSLFFISEDYGCVANTNIKCTEDDGSTWGSDLLTASLTNSIEKLVMLYDNSSSSFNQGIAIDASGNLYVISGSTSTLTYSGTTFEDLSYYGGDYIYALTSGGGVKAYEISTATWSTYNNVENTNDGDATNDISLPSGTDMHALFVNYFDDQACAAGDGGEIRYSEDLYAQSSCTWDDESEYTAIPPLNGACTYHDASTDLAWAVGDDAIVLKSDDDMITWTVEETSYTTDLQDVAYNSTSGHTTIVGDDAFISEYDGGTWTTYGQGYSDDLYAVVGGSEVLVAGENDRVTKEVSGAYNTVYPDAYAYNLQSLRDITYDPSTTTSVVAVGDNGKILVSANGGSSWTYPLSFVLDELYASFKLDENTAFAGGKNGAIYRTTDKGASWTTLSNAGGIDISGIFFKDAYNGAVIGNIAADAEVYYTSNKGTTWTNTGAFAGQTINDIYFPEDYFGIIIGDNGAIYTTSQLLSTSSTVSWQDISGLGGSTGTDLNAITFVDDKNAFVAGDGSTVYYTNDQFTSLNPVTISGLTADLIDIHFTDYYRGYVLANDNSIYKSIDKGLTWDSKTLTLQTGQDVNSFTFIDPYQLFISGSANFAKYIEDYSDLYSSRFYYDKLGRLVASQNTKQYNVSKASWSTTPVYQYSYTVYDALGRIEEVGEILADADIEDYYTAGQLDDYDTWLNNGSKNEVTKTYYDDELFYFQGAFGFTQENLRGRVASVLYFEEDDPAVADVYDYDYATHYSYDIHGNVKQMVQDIRELVPLYEHIKLINYDYDLVSGNVKNVSYQPDDADEFWHNYEYDADNRIQQVYTGSRQVPNSSLLADQDAYYTYYEHGPLMRAEIGEEDIQGIDYAYTIQGWLKGVNSNTLVDPERDMGRDGDPSVSGVDLFAQDEFGFTLGYYNEEVSGTRIKDYVPIGISDANFVSFEADLLDSGNESDLLDGGASASPENKSLYNGNISHMVTATRQFMTCGSGPVGMRYSYDQLNRISEARMYSNIDLTNNNWNDDGTVPSTYLCTYDYDANGNITELTRNDHLGNLFDDFSYKYENTDDITTGCDRNTNKLRAVIDDVSTNYGYGDIQNTQVFDNDISGTDDNNYQYDELGNLIQDVDEEIEEITWTVSGKVKEVKRYSSSSKSSLEFAYDASGNRILKIEKPQSGSGIPDEVDWIYTYYVRDASGNIMAIYKKTYVDNGSDYDALFSLEEIPIYGSSRLGRLKVGEQIATVNFTASGFDVDDKKFTDLSYSSSSNTTQADEYNFIRGNKDYELSNHLGNVLATVSDRRIPVDGTYTFQEDGTGLFNLEDGIYKIATGCYNLGTGPDGTIDYYHAVVTTASDYYPFGMQMPDRTYTKSEMGDEVINYDFQNSSGTWGGTLNPTVQGSPNYRLIAQGTGQWYDAYTTFTTEVGKTYRVSFYIDLGNNSPRVKYFVCDHSNPATVMYSKSVFYDKNGVTQLKHNVSFEFTATVTNTRLAFQRAATSGTLYYFYLDNVKVEEVDGNKDYRFGFNGMEKDDEVNGTGSSYTAEFWQYDPRLGRRWNIDPIDKLWESSYLCFSGNPILIVDPKGDDGYVDKDGNYLGDDNNEDSHETRVLDAEQWNDIVGDVKNITDDMRTKLVKEGTLLQNYSDGISITDDTWNKLETNGGTRITPWVQNNSNYIIFVKPELTKESNDVLPGQEVYGKIDGLATPHIRKNEVFKVVDGTRTNITNDKIIWSPTTTMAKFGQRAIGGWHNETWLNKMSANEIHYIQYAYVLIFIKVKVLDETVKQTPDDGWVNLFKDSGIKDAKKYLQPHTFIEENTLYWR